MRIADVGHHHLEHLLDAGVAEGATDVARPSAQDDETQVSFRSCAATFAALGARCRVEVEGGQRLGDAEILRTVRLFYEAEA